MTVAGPAPTRGSPRRGHAGAEGPRPVERRADVPLRLSDFNLFVATARFNVFAANDVEYLTARQHEVVYCNHNRGHTLPTAILGSRVVQFFAAHPRNVTASPWATALPTGWPSYCAFRGRS